jgi:hypothetical protein
MIGRAPGETFTHGESPAETGARVANALADAIPTGSEATHRAARTFSDREVILGLSFLASVLEIAAASAKALAIVQRERCLHPGPRLVAERPEDGPSVH